MRDNLRFIDLVVGIVLLLGTVIFGLQYLHYKWIGFWKPKYQSVERDVFQNTKSYDFGVQQDLAKYRYEWLRADSVGKRAIENVVRQRFSEYPPDRIKDRVLRNWFESILRGNIPTN